MDGDVAVGIRQQGQPVREKQFQSQGFTVLQGSLFLRCAGIGKGSLSAVLFIVGEDIPEYYAHADHKHQGHKSNR